jgi:hypothetical protein
MSLSDSVKRNILKLQHDNSLAQLDLEDMMKFNFDDIKSIPHTYGYRVAIQKNKIDMLKLQIERNEIEIAYMKSMWIA